MRMPIVKVIAPRFLKLISFVIDIGNITLMPLIISEDEMDPLDFNHESIHVVQQLEIALISAMLFMVASVLISPWLTLGVIWSFIPFVGPYYILYASQWVYTWVRIGKVSQMIINQYHGVDDRGSAAYHLIPFEQEAYENGDNLEYLSERKFFAWLRYGIPTDGTIPWVDK